jgi:hypothetical protein
MTCQPSSLAIHDRHKKKVSLRLWGASSTIEDVDSVPTLDSLLSEEVEWNWNSTKGKLADHLQF